MIKYSPTCEFNKLDRKLQNNCNILDRALDIDIIATSGLRSPEKNTQVGGVPKSSHLNGLAIDFICSDSKVRYKLIMASLVAGFQRIGIGKNHIHLDIDTDKPYPIIFFDGI